MNNSLIAKRIPGVEPPSLVLVDAFRHTAEQECRFFFLSHFHADHYQGLTEQWDAGPILCSGVTARLVVEIIGVSSSYVRPLPFDQEVELVPGVAVTLLDANHCPGAALLLFRVGKEEPVYHLHTGDMRYHERMRAYPALQGIRVDTVLLDTTYSHPRYEHMPQEDAMEAAALAVLGTLAKDQEQDQASPASGSDGPPPPRRKTLILLSAYKLGKERILLHVAKRTGLPIYVDGDKVRVMSCLDLAKEDLARFTTDPTATPLHVCRMGFCGEMWPYFRPNFNNLQRYLDEHGQQGYTHIHGIIPTGWADGSNWNRRNALRDKDQCSVQLIPYSEHSNFPELQDFVSFLRPRSVMPTVFSDEKDRAAIAKRFRHAVDRTANKRAFLSLFGGGKTSTPAAGGGGGSGKDVTAVAMEGQEEEVVVLRRGDEDEDAESKEVKRARGCCEALEPVADAGGGAGHGGSTGGSAGQGGKVELAAAAGHSGSTGEEKKGEGFVCQACTYMNQGVEANRSDCAICGTARPDSKAKQRQPQKQSQRGGSSGKEGARSRGSSKAKSPPAPAQPGKGPQQRTMLGYLRGREPPAASQGES